MTPGHAMAIMPDMTPEQIISELKKRGISQAVLARAIGLGPDKLSRSLKGKRRFQVEEHRKILDFFQRHTSGAVNPELSHGLATEPLKPEPLRRSELNLSGRMIPVYGQAVGGSDGRFLFNGSQVAEVVCIPALESVPGAYAIFVSGDSMVPRFKPGETVFVHPSKPPRHGADVVIQLVPEDEDSPPEGFIKEFVSHTAESLTVYQHNPPKTLKIPSDRVLSVHLIMGSSP